MRLPATRVSDWLLTPDPRPDADVRLLCLPHGGTAAFWPWAERLPPEIEVSVVQLPGRESRLREEPIDAMHDLISAVRSEVQNGLAEPVVVFGHSVGALLAYELAVGLQRMDAPPAGLIVAGQNSPAPGSSGSEAVGQPIPDADELTDEALAAQLEQLGGTPQEVLDNPEILSLLLPAFRADVELIRSYVPSAEPILDCPIKAYGGLEDDMTSRSGLQAWAERTRQSHNVRMFEGGHFFIETAQDLVLQALARDAFEAAAR